MSVDARKEGAEARVWAAVLTHATEKEICMHLIHPENLQKYLDVCKNRDSECRTPEFKTAHHAALDLFVVELRDSVDACVELGSMTNGSSLDISKIRVLSDAIVWLKTGLMMYTAFAAERLEHCSDILTDDDVRKYDTLLLWIRQQSAKFGEYVCYSQELVDTKVNDDIALCCENEVGLTADRVMRCDEMILARLALLSRDRSEDHGSGRQKPNEDDFVMSTLVPAPSAMEDATEVSEHAGDEAPLPRTTVACATSVDARKKGAEARAWAAVMTRVQPEQIYTQLFRRWKYSKIRRVMPISRLST